MQEKTIYKNTTGIHFYINIKNFDKLVKIDEADGDMSHMFHFLNTFLGTLERYVRDSFDKDYVRIEKLTGSRIHLIVYGDCNTAFRAFLNITNFAYKLSSHLSQHPKYKTLSAVSLQVGGDYGSFVDYIFEDLSKDFEEYTSIGYPANFACKLQTIADAGEIIISKRIYDRVPSLNRTTIKPIDSSRQNKIYSKYPDLGNVAYIVKSSERNDFYNNLNESFLFESINNKRIDYQHYFDVATAIADKTNIGDMDTIEPNKLDFKNWNIRKSAKFNAAVVFADVRDFTRKFNSDGSNLNSMSTITKNVLGCMYSNCKKNFGVHVQFQGDREFAFFDGDSIQFAVLFALRLRSEISKLCDGIEVGIGINYGQVYASQIGIESEENNIEKQNIMLGETIKEANKLEDECANKGEVVISNAVYNLVSSNRNIKSLFTKRDYYWVTKSTFIDYSKLSTNSEYNKNRNQSTYKPWNQR